MSQKIILLFLLFLGIILAVRITVYFASQHNYKAGDKLSLTTTIFTEPTEYPYEQELNLTLPSGQNLLVTLPTKPDLSYGDQISISGTIKNKKIGENSILALDFPRLSVKLASQNPVLAIPAALRYKIAEFYDENLPPVPSSLLLGIVFGIKENIPSDFSTLLKNSGVTHVIAASGMNISMTAGFFAFIFTKFMRRKLALVLTIFAILFYSLISGLEPSILRAALMGVIAFSAQILGRQNNSIFALLLTAFVILFFSPILLLDVGFQLSFFSTLGILTMNPLLEAHISRLRLLKIVGGDLATTLSAQLFTLPIILGTFGTYSLISVFVNILVLWTVPILMVLGALGSFLGIIFEPLGIPLLYASYPFLIYFEWVVRSLGSLGFLIKTTSLPIEITVGYYLLLASFFVKTKTKAKTK